MKLQTYLLGLLFFLPAGMYAQTNARIENVDFRVVNEKEIWVTYDIVDALNSETFDVSMEVSLDGGKTYTIVPKTVSGDVGENVEGGSGKKIVWAAEKDLGQIASDDLLTRLNATVKTVTGFYLFYSVGFAYMTIPYQTWQYRLRNDLTYENYDLDTTSLKGVGFSYSSGLYILPAIGYKINKNLSVEVMMFGAFPFFGNGADKMEYSNDPYGIFIDGKYDFVSKQWSPFLKVGICVYNYQTDFDKITVFAGMDHFLNTHWSMGFEGGLLIPSRHTGLISASILFQYHI
jgi:hypothetical protein